MSQKVATFKLSVTLSTLNRFSKFLYCWKAYAICYKTHTTLLTLGMLLHYLVKLKIQILCIYSAYMEKNANKLHFYRLLLCYSSTNLIFSMFKIANCSAYWLQLKFSCHCSFACLLLQSICGTGNSSQQTSLQYLSKINMVFSDEDNINTPSMQSYA